jgi:hypothetical protein
MKKERKEVGTILSEDVHVMLELSRTSGASSEQHSRLNE